MNKGVIIGIIVSIIGIAVTIAVIPPTPEQPPFAVIQKSKEPYVIGKPITFSGVDSTDADGYVATYLWKLGDGNSKEGSSIEYTYLEPGGYTVSLTITDNDGLVNTKTIDITINGDNDTETSHPVKPEAIIAGPKSIILNSEVTFSGDNSTDQDGHIETWQWYVNGEKIIEAPFLTYTFTSPGYHSIDLVVFDNDKQSHKRTLVVNVEIKENPSTPTVKSYGPMKNYQEFTQSPFFEFVDNSSYFYLDDFEKGYLSIPGIEISEGEVYSEKDLVDSVDKDDGYKDGYGLGGKSYLLGPSSQRSGTEVVIFTFNNQELSQPPNYFGIVLTDFTCSQIGNTYTAEILFEVYDTKGNPIKTDDKITFGTKNKQGETSEDMFWGVYYSEGISRIKMEYSDPRICGGYKYLEFDHLQYGRTN